ncbi:hypothetical protein FOZ63_009552, partial [Perkinsus olseni]
MTTSTTTAGVGRERQLRHLCRTLEFLAFLTEKDFGRLMRVCRVCRLESNSAEEKWFREFHLSRRLFGKRTSRVIQPPEGLTLKDLSIISSRLPLAFDTDRPPAIADVTFTDEGEHKRSDSDYSSKAY